MIYQFEHGETTSCEWCDGEEHCISRARWTRLLMSGKTITASGDENASIEINYCPNCGRKINKDEPYANKIMATIMEGEEEVNDRD